MAKNLEIVLYNESYKEKWDNFVMNKSVNGTFLQTKRFLDYHATNCFHDNSILFINGNDIVAVIPGHIISSTQKKTLCSHLGSTFGGIVLDKHCCKISYIDTIFSKLHQYLIEENFTDILLKQTSRIYQKIESEILDYYFFLNGYSNFQEVGYYIDYNRYDNDIISNFSASTRRDYRYSLKKEFIFKELSNIDEIEKFYKVLCDNYKKFSKKPIHSLEELIDFKFNRLNSEVKFFGIYFEKELIAGSMVFLFEKQVFHTQYIAVLQNRTKIFVSEFLYKNLIELAKNSGYRYLSFGTATLNNGKIFNRQLAKFKESFGTIGYTNKIYYKSLKSGCVID